MSIRVLIADDQPLMRAALAMSLAAEPDIEVVAEAADGVEAIELSESLEPDLVVMDSRMPRVDGVAATWQLTHPGRGAPRKVLIITTFHLDDYVVEALRAGASGFLLKDATAAHLEIVRRARGTAIDDNLLKDATAAELVRAVRVVAAGDALLAPSVTKRLLDQYLRRLPVRAGPDPDPAKTITKRELAVLMLVAKGLSNAAIGAELYLAESSVKTHIGHLLAKLGQRDRVQLVIYAYETGLVVPATFGTVDN